VSLKLGINELSSSPESATDSSDTFAPIVLFVYNRLEHTQSTVRALQNNQLAENSDLFVFADGASNAESVVSVEQVRAYIKTIVGFKSVQIFEREKNYGLANSIVDGVTQICGKYGRVIVLEDDLVTTPYFLQYMNDALKVYEHDEDVASIHGYWYPVDCQVEETFFLRGASCWGWATWQPMWKLFELDGKKLLTEIRRRKLTGKFDLDGAMRYRRMLEDQISGRNNSWAIRWHAATFLANKMSLYPGRSVVRNIGFDGTGTHCSVTNSFDVELAGTPIRVSRMPVVESTEARSALIRYYRRNHRGIFTRIAGRIRRIVGF
jgi:hypothetical protein